MHTGKIHIQETKSMFQYFPLRQTWRFQLPYHKLSVPEQQYSIFASLWCFYLTAPTVCQGLLLLWMFYSKGGTTQFHLSSSDRDMSWNVWNRPSGSFMVDMGISSNIMKSPSPKCYMTFWDMIIYNDTTLNWSDITPICELITELVQDIITDFALLPIFGGFHWTLQRVRLANRGRLLLRTPGPVPFVLMLRPLFPELVMSTDLLSFEHPSVLLFCLINRTFAVRKLTWLLRDIHVYYHEIPFFYLAWKDNTRKESRIAK